MHRKIREVLYEINFIERERGWLVKMAFGLVYEPGFILFFRSQISRTQIAFSRALKFTLTPTLPRS